MVVLRQIMNLRGQPHDWKSRSLLVVIRTLDPMDLPQCLLVPYGAIELREFLFERRVEPNCLLSKGV